jgi:hypothetical protein
VPIGLLSRLLYVTSLLLYLALSPQAITLNMAQRDVFSHVDGVEQKAGRLVLESQEGQWTELFKGKPSFGYVTGVFSFFDKLFFFDSPVPAGSDGGDIYVWDQKLGKPAKIGAVQEQGVTYMRQNGKNLYIPGPDAMESWDKANIYRSTDSGQKWTKVRTIPNGVHVWDLCFWRGKLYVSTGSVKKAEGYGAVLESSDDGKTWKEVLAAYPPDKKKQFARCYVLIPLPDGLYASWIVVDNDPKKPGPRQQNDFYRYDGKKWTPLTLFTAPPRTPYFGLRHREFRDFSLIGARGTSFMLRDGRVTALEGLGNLTVLDFCALDEKELLAVATDGQTKESAIYRASIAPFGDRLTGFTKTAALPAGQEGLAVQVVNGKTYVGTRAEGGGRLLSEGAVTDGFAITKPVRVRNRSSIRVTWEGQQPAGSSLQFQVHAARSQREVLRMTDWPETPGTTSPASLTLKGLPQGEIWIQLKLVLRSDNGVSMPELSSLRIEPL